MSEAAAELVFKEAEAASSLALMAGLGLPERWRDKSEFTILATSFGAGRDFLLVWQKWLDDPNKCSRLHFVAIDKAPVSRQELAQAHQKIKADSPELSALCDKLVSVWPEALHGVHRLLLGENGPSLTLAVGDVATMISELRLSADAIFLTGFSPQSKAEPAQMRVLKHCARLTRSGGALVAWADAPHVRAYLAAAGFEIDEVRSSDGVHKGEHRHTITARPRWRANVQAAASPWTQDKRAVVIGAGIAGAAVVDRLIERGWQVTLLDRAAEPATGASGLWLGAMHPHFSQDDCHLSRASRAALILAVQRWNELLLNQPGCGWIPCGVAHPATSLEEEMAMRELIARMKLPLHLLEFLERAELSVKAGADLPYGGYWHAETGVVDARKLIACLIEQAGVTWRPNAEVLGLARINEEWQALGKDGAVLAQAPVMILANAGDANHLLPELELMHPVRGQMTGVSESLLSAPQAAVVGYGYVLPAVQGRVSIGATYDPGTLSQAVREQDHQLNLQSLTTLMPASKSLPLDADFEAFVGTRFAARDHLPLIGPVPDVSNQEWLAKAAGKRLTDLPRQQGLFCAVGYGSRGLTWSVLAGEILASYLHGEPAPLEVALIDAVDPARFVRRRLRSATGVTQ
jgi:tRNA 5-methylaminomethyl-2-thiouridine biosynthesis bifunctional protein